MANRFLKIFERFCIAVAVICLLYAIYQVWFMKNVRGPFAQKRYYQLGDVSPNGYLNKEFAEKIKSDLSHDELISDLMDLKKVSDATGQAETQLIIDELNRDTAAEAASATTVTNATAVLPPELPSATEPVALPEAKPTTEAIAPPPLPATSNQ